MLIYLLIKCKFGNNDPSVVKTFHIYCWNNNNLYGYEEALIWCRRTAHIQKDSLVNSHRI